MRHKLPTLAAISIVVLSSSVLFAAAPRAQAQPDLLVCSGMQTVGYDPPITNDPMATTADIAESYSPCLDLSDLTLASGESSFSVDEIASCASLNESDDIATYYWNNGETSTVDFADTTVARLADGSTDVTSVGTVVSGFGSGATATREVILPQLDVTACEGTGVWQESGTATLTFV